jgi:dihydrofolate synthase/folylpolyglutamate synthase
MEYSEVIEYLYNQYPAFQKVGARAFKPGLDNTLRLDAICRSPRRSFKTIHVAGTNGKGSVSHTLASILQASGYRVGLHTSPHLVSFRERIRVNGEMISEKAVVSFVEQIKDVANEIKPSFFELTMMMAFDYFRSQKVDVAVIEVGLGGRMDSTNIIKPQLSVITNIGLDHTMFLGETVEEIATEKAGIIKSKTPVIIGEYDKRTAPIFRDKAKEVGAPITFAADEVTMKSIDTIGEWDHYVIEYKNKQVIEVDFSLTGLCQQKNILTILAAVEQLRAIGYKISIFQLMIGLETVQDSTGLMGRWQKIATEPDTIVDTGHNEHGIRLVAEQLKRTHYDTIHIVWGMANDKHPESVLPLLPRNAKYYFTRANIERALSEEDLAQEAMKCGLRGQTFKTVALALENAKKNAGLNDLIFIGGSNYVVAEVL